jgi:hypothetical protein
MRSRPLFSYPGRRPQLGWRIDTAGVMRRGISLPALFSHSAAYLQQAVRA